MIRTIIFLILTLLLVPVVSYKMDVPPSALQYTILILLLKIAFAVAISCFLLSEITNNASQVDKIWSLIPIVYVWVVAYHTQWQSRITMMAILVSIWGLRLTFNFARRGGYHWIPWKGEEDYRWKMMREKPFLKSKTAWMLFDLFFISLYQNGLILLFTLPIVYCIQETNEPLVFLDYLIAFFFLLFVIIETIADQQQFNYQSMKYKLKAENKVLSAPYDKGFVHTGLWKFVRHPNYACEQAIWICFYLFCIPASGHFFNWSVTGCILLMLLFIGSSDFSESISKEKYPEYASYLKNTSRFIPFIK